MNDVNSTDITANVFYHIQLIKVFWIECEDFLKYIFNRTTWHKTFLKRTDRECYVRVFVAKEEYFPVGNITRMWRGLIDEEIISVQIFILQFHKNDIPTAKKSPQVAEIFAVMKQNSIPDSFTVYHNQVLSIKLRYNIHCV
jgi:hypothetical protein